VIGADGAFSAVRQQLLRRERYDYSQAWLAHGYKELVIPPATDGGFAMDPGALHIWPRGGYMMMAMPNLDRSFTVTLYLAFEGGPASFAALREAGAVEQFFRREFPDAVPLMPRLVEDFAANVTGTLVTVRTRPWHEGRVVLVGDACHAIVPFFGQGANAAFEDVIALGDSLARHDEPGAAFAEYEARRKRHADAIADLALANFEEMRDHVASWRFRWRKRLEQALHALLPRLFVPLYTMISFTTIPYADAQDRARRQDRAIRVTGVVAGLALLITLLLLLRG
jgi:kynurenine 3-monooxygenase